MLELSSASLVVEYRDGDYLFTRMRSFKRKLVQSLQAIRKSEVVYLENWDGLKASVN